MVIGEVVHVSLSESSTDAEGQSPSVGGTSDAMPPLSSAQGIRNEKNPKTTEYMAIPTRVSGESTNEATNPVPPNSKPKPNETIVSDAVALRIRNSFLQLLHGQLRPCIAGQMKSSPTLIFARQTGQAALRESLVHRTLGRSSGFGASYGFSFILDIHGVHCLIILSYRTPA